MKTGFLFLILFNSSIFFAQRTMVNQREIRPFGIGIQAIGPTIIGQVVAQYFITPNFSIEAGSGFFPGAYGGVKIHLVDQYSSSPFAVHVGLNGFNSAIGTYQFYGVSFPVGFNIICQNGIQISADLAFTKYFDGSDDTIPFIPSLKLGYQFKRSKAKI